MMKRFLKYLLIVLLVVVLIVVGYLVYLFTAYYRVPDNQKLTVDNSRHADVQVDKNYRAMTYNIGYGSYPPSYTFFMDGGKKSIADSKQSVVDNIDGVIKTTKEVDPEFAFYQEVDEHGKRSRNVNEQKQISSSLESEYGSVFGQNYDSPYLFFPVTKPIGKAKSGLLALSKAKMEHAKRYSLPIDTDINKFFDLDRAFTVTTSPVANGKKMILIDVHLSAYTKSAKVQNAQLKKMFNVMEDEYKKGNYVMVGGDYNHDTLGDSPKVFHTANQHLTWNKPFPKDKIPAGFHMPMGSLREDAVPSARNLNEPYKKGKSFVTMIDGFIVSDNIQVKDVKVKDPSFAYSDHNPLVMNFKLKS